MILIVAGTATAIAGTDVPRINTVSGLDPSPGIQNETSLIQNKPAFPQNIVVFHHDDSDADGTEGPDVGVSFSNNYGAAGSWNHTHLLTGLGAGALVYDPAIAADTQGNLYGTFIGDTGTLYQPPVGVYISRSTNQGATWSSISPIRTWATGLPWYLDKPWITVDTYSSSSYTDRIYVTWQEDDLNSAPRSIIYFSRSSRTTYPSFSTAIRLTDTNRVGTMDNGPVPAVAPNGDLYVAWLDSNITNPNSPPARIRVDKSTDGGQTWPGPNAGDEIVSNFTAVPKFPLAGNAFKQVSFPSIATDPTNSQNVYLVYAADPDGVGPDNGNIYFHRSTDGGQTWSGGLAPALRVNDDGGTNDQFQPWVDVKPNGFIDVVWMDGRNDTGGAPKDTFDIYMATSMNSGSSFGANQRVSDASFSVGGTNASAGSLGEYPGLDVDTSTAYIAWTNIDAAADRDIFFDQMLNPQNTSTGTSVLTSMNNVSHLPVTAAFANVITAGNTYSSSVNVASHPPPAGYTFVPGDDGFYGYFDLVTTAQYTGDIDIELGYDPALVGSNEAGLRLFHWNDSLNQWDDITVSVDTANNNIVGTTSSLSPFALGLPFTPTGVNSYWLAFLAFALIFVGTLLMFRQLAINRPTV